jgi:hypothetical protein
VLRWAAVPVGLVGAGLILSGTAWADTFPTLRDARVLAVTAPNQQPAGRCGVSQRQDQDAWVFAWPGQSAGELVHLTVRFDTDGNDRADTSRTELDAQPVGPTGMRYAVVTPAGWLLVDGTSQITGTSAQNRFQLSTVCAGQEAPQTPPVPVPPSGSPAPGASVPASAPLPASPQPSLTSASASPAPAPATSGADVATSAAGVGSVGGPGVPAAAVAEPRSAVPSPERLSTVSHDGPLARVVLGTLLAVAALAALAGRRWRRVEAVTALAVAAHSRARRHTPRHAQH